MPRPGWVEFYQLAADELTRAVQSSAESNRQVFVIDQNRLHAFTEYLFSTVDVSDGVPKSNVRSGTRSRPTRSVVGRSLSAEG